MIKNSISFSGLLFFLAGAVILMGIITGEIYYPSGYTTRDSEISDLGATRPPGSVVAHPSADIFNTSMIISGLLILAGVYFLNKSQNKKLLIATAGLLGVGVLGVGIFPGNHGGIHPIFAMLAFIFGGISAMASHSLIVGPLKKVVPVLGIITLVTLFFADSFIPMLGDGGTERWVAYPVVLWLVVFGGYLMGKNA